MSSLFELWRPSLPESIDGKPLASSVGELFFDFPYDRLPENNLLAFFMKPESVLGLVLFYLLSKPPLKAFTVNYGSNGTKLFRNAVAIHNFALAAYSAVTVVYAWPIVIQHFIQKGFMETYCDANGTLWQESGFGALATIFYLSKYYEFLDTWILVLKGKDASFLQTYHHAGIVACMWGGVCSQSSWLIFVVLFNSFIHTLMYSYFFIKTLSPKMEIKSAKYLTTAQIGQFFLGIACSFAILFLGNDCNSASSRFSLWCLQVYGYGLIALFAAFANRKYSKKKSP